MWYLFETLLLSYISPVSFSFSVVVTLKPLFSIKKDPKSLTPYPSSWILIACSNFHLLGGEGLLYHPEAESSMVADQVDDSDLPITSEC